MHVYRERSSSGPIFGSVPLSKTQNLTNAWAVKIEKPAD